MAGVAAADLDPHLCRREIELVVDDDERAEVQLRIAQSLADAAPGFVHVGLRLEQHDPLIADQPVRQQALMPGAKRAEPAPPLGDGVNRHEADVVAVARVLSARIAEARNDQHGVPDRSA